MSKTHMAAQRKGKAKPKGKSPPKIKKVDPSVISHQEETFAQHYVLNQNGRHAYRHAFPGAQNWKDTTVDSRASELLATSKVQGRLTVLRMKLQVVAEKQFEITAEKVLAEYAAIAFTPAADYSRWGKKTVRRQRKTGRKDAGGYPVYEEVDVEIDFVEFTPSDELTEVQRKVIAGPELSVDKFGNTILTVKPLDRLKALDRLAKYVGLDDGRTVVEHRIKGSVVHTHEVKQIEDAGTDKEALKIFDAFLVSAGAYALK